MNEMQTRKALQAELQAFFKDTIDADGQLKIGIFRRYPDGTIDYMIHVNSPRISKNPQIVCMLSSRRFADNYACLDAIYDAGKSWITGAKIACDAFDDWEAERRLLRQVQQGKNNYVILTIVKYSMCSKG